MKTIWWVFCMGLLAACAAQHAARVSCDGKLRPINSPAPASGGVRADSAARKSVDGVP